MCEYLHETDKTDKNKEPESRCNVKSDKEVQTEPLRSTKEQEVQTEEEDNCFCKEECNVSTVQYDEDKVICILKRATSSEEEWEELEKK